MSESIFRARTSIFDFGRWFFLSFRLVFVVGDRAGPGTYFHAQESIFHAQDSIFHTQDSMFMLGDAWGTPGGLVLS